MATSNVLQLNNGYKIPMIGLGVIGGCDKDVRRALRIALKVGYRSIDTSYLSMSDDAIGDELQDWFSKGKLKREDVFVTSKLPTYGNRPEDVNKFLTLSLQKLKLDYLDLYSIHHPFGIECENDLKTFKIGPNNDACLFDTDLEEIWRSMEKEVEAGRIKSLGLSHFNSKQIERIISIAKYPPAVLHIENHPYFQQVPLVEFCQKRGIVVVAYRNFGAFQDIQTQDGNSGMRPLLRNPTVINLCKKHSKSPGQIVLRFLLQRNIVVIPCTLKPEFIISNFKITDFVLPEQDMKALYKMDQPKMRTIHFKDSFPGCENHKEYPFHEEF